MSSVTQKLTNLKLIKPPEFLPTNVHYETIMGSVAYGVSSDTSDTDIYGFCIPPKTMIFPHLAGEIEGFGTQKQRFEQYQQHGIIEPSKNVNYDLNIYNIVKYFQLCMENNPNMIDSLFTPINCVLHITQIGNMVRDNRKLFLHKGVWHKMKGFAYSQLSKSSNVASKPEIKEVRDYEEEYNIPHTTKFYDVTIEIDVRRLYKPSKSLLCHLTTDQLEDYLSIYKKGIATTKRFESQKIHNTDLKFLYHVVRLLSQAEQILIEGDLNLQETGRREHMKAIRRGDVSEQDIRDWAASKEKQLEVLYNTSTLQYRPNENKIKQLLLDCLEAHYGSLNNSFVNPDRAITALQEISDVINRNRELLNG